MPGTAEAVTRLPSRVSSFPATTAATALPQDTFRFGDRAVRVVMRAGEPWFVARGVCDVLGYRKPADALRHVDSDEYVVLTSDTVSAGQPESALFTPSTGNLRTQVTLISEPGLFTLILRSNRPAARAFKRWVTHEVLPTIRKTGGYSLAVPTTLAGALRLAADQQSHLEAAQRELAAQEEELAEAAPKAEDYDAFMDTTGALSMGAVGNLLGIGRTRLFAVLRARGVLQGDNRPYQRYMRHFKVVAHTYTGRDGVQEAAYTTLVRPIGVGFLRRELADNDRRAPLSRGLR